MSYNTLRAAVLAADSKGGGRLIEDPAHVENIVWQTRSQPLTQAEEDLADALMAVFAEGAWELSETCAALEARGAKASDGTAFTPESLKAHLAVLGSGI